ncbi:MAG: phage major capsid protein [Burkholderiaceae bacterium]|jgi:HK97 family phage major capsid protein|nr:phage major capsid protein [Burkholderiaceae bacterium]
MLLSQKIARRQSEIRENLARLAGIETPTDEQRSELATLDTEYSTNEQRYRAALTSEDTERRAASEVPSDTAALEKRVSVLRVVQAAIAGRQLDGAEREYHQEAERRSGQSAQGTYVPLNSLEKRINLTTTAGDLVPTDHRGDLYIGPLRDSLVVRSLGVRTLSGLRGNIEIPKAGTGITSGWVGENEALPEDDLTFEGVTMKPRHVGAISSWSRQLAQQSDPSIEALLRDDLAYTIGHAVDTAIISGDGATEPLGILNAAGVQTASAPATWDDVLAVEGLLEDVNIKPNAWYTSPAVLRTLRGTLKDSVAGATYIATKTAIGEVPAYVSNAAPAGKAILGDWSQAIFGTWSAVDLLVNPYEGEAYRRGNVLIRAILTADLVLRHDKAFVVTG